MRLIPTDEKFHELFIAHGERVQEAANKLERAMEGANCVVLGVAHEEFRSLTLGFIASHCRKPAAIIDFGHIFNPAEVEKEGFIYRAAGRGVWTK